MTDNKTNIAYAKLAQAFSDDWNAQPIPSDMYELFQRFLKKEGATIEIGCGNGRDAHWLAGHGYSVDAFDSSKELVTIAKNLYPNNYFGLANLPDLQEVKQVYDNVICETVIMHLPITQIPIAIENLKRILKTNGILYLSWRVTKDHDERHSDGRLYSAFEPDFILAQFSNFKVLHFEDKTSASSGKRVCRLIVKKTSTDLD